MKKNRNILWGLFFLAIGITIVVGQFFTLDFDLFHVIITILLIVCALQNIKRRDWILVIMPIVFAIWINRSILGIQEYIKFWPLMWAGGFTTVGLYIIFNKSDKYKHHYSRTFEFSTRNDSYEANEDIVDISTMLSGDSRYLYSTNLIRVNASCTLGSLQIYFDQAIPCEEGAVIDVDCELGGIELYIPKEWEVVNNISAILGGVEEVRKYRNDVQRDGTYKVTIQGNVTLGGVEIIYI